MRRQRFQKGSVHLRKHGRHRVWIAQWWENGGKRSKVLGNYPSIVKGQAEAMLSQLLAPMNQTAGHRQIPIYTFQQYVESVFLPAMRGKWKESTRSTSEPDIIRYLVPAFGQLLVHMISREQMQKFLHEKASQLSESIVGHLRWHLNAIYSMAQSDGLVEYNPAGALFTPACRPSPEKRVLVGSEVRMALRLLGLRERLIFRMAVFDGMRPGEIFAIQLGRIDETSVRIDRRIYDGNVDSPKGRKGKNTSRTVALSQGTLADLDIWRRLLQDQADDAYLFPSETGTTPLRPNNVWKRAFRPCLQMVGLEWVTFQVLRRTNASLSRKARVDDKVSADQRGHGLGVSLGVYSISDLDQKIEAVQKLESDVFESARDADLRG
jgi:integrase